MGGIDAKTLNELLDLSMIAASWNQSKFINSLPDTSRARYGLAKVVFGPSSLLHTLSLRSFGNERAMTKLGPS